MSHVSSIILLRHPFLNFLLMSLPSRPLQLVVAVVVALMAVGVMVVILTPVVVLGVTVDVTMVVATLLFHQILNPSVKFALNLDILHLTAISVLIRRIRVSLLLIWPIIVLRPPLLMVLGT